MPQSAILDQWGRPIDLGAIREPQAQTQQSGQAGKQGESMLSSIYTEFANHPARGLTPERVNTIMRAAEQGDLVQQVDLADDMEERDGHIYSELDKRRQALLEFDWDVLPPDNATAEEEKMADQVKEWLCSIANFEQRVLLPLTDGIMKGFANVSIWWEPEERTLQPRFEFILPRCFTMNYERTEITLRNNSSAYGEALRPYNWIAHRHPCGAGALARLGLCRRLILPYLYKNYATRDFAEFLEIYGLPLRLGKFPAGASDDEKRTLLQAVVSIGHNAAGIIPTGMEINFQNAASGTEVPFGAMMDRMDALQSKIIVGQTLTSSEGQHGTQALGKVHEGVLTRISKADAKLIAATLSAQLVAPMALLNIAGANPRRLPRFHIEVPEPEDIAGLATSLPALAKAGMRIGVDWAHKKTGIPKADEDDEVLRGAPDPADPADPAAPGADPAVGGQGTPAAQARTKPAPAPAARTAQAQLNALPGNAPPRDAIDDLVDEELANWQPLLQPAVDPLLAAVDQAIAAGESAEQFQARLPALLSAIDTQALAERIARAAFVTRLAGAADLDLER